MVRVRIERENWVFISAYGQGSERSEEEIEEFCSELSECVGTFGGNESVVALGNLKSRVGNEEIEVIVRQHGVPERNESGERLLEMCAEQELVVSNSWFQKKDLHKYAVENGKRKGDIPGIDELCDVTKTNAWKTFRCETVERRRWRNV